MKAKTINNSPFGWNTTVYDNDDYPMEYTLNGLVNKHDAVGVTESFNLELSAHVAKETERLQAEIDTVKREKLVLNLLIDEITDGNCLKQSKAKLSVENSELKSEIDRLKKEVEMQNQDINNHQQTSATLNKMYKQAIDDLTISQAEVERLKQIPQNIINEFENIKRTKCKTLQEVVFFDGVIAFIESKFNPLATPPTTKVE